MKKVIVAILLIVVLMVGMAAPAVASSLGISPPYVEVEIPQGGSATVDFKVYYFEGEVKVSLVGIPLEVEPSVFNIATSPADIELTLHSKSTSPTEYNGYIKFEGEANTSVSLVVNVKATVTVTLNANIQPRLSTGGGGGGGITTSVPVVTTASDGAVNVSVPRGAVMRNKAGIIIYNLSVLENNNPPPAPEAANVIGLAYNFEPSGATFSTPVTLTFNYTQDAVPEGVNEEDLVVAFYDEVKGEWVELECEVDTVNNVITAKVSHFTVFAIIGKLPPPTLPTPAPAPAPEPVLEPKPAPKPAPVIVPVPEPLPAPLPTVTPLPPPLPVEKGIGGWIIAGISFMVVLAIISVIAVIRRKRKQISSI